MPDHELATTEIIEIDPPRHTKPYLCRHIFTDGHRCGSRALLHENFCYYHHAHRKPVLKRHAIKQHPDLGLKSLDDLDEEADEEDEDDEDDDDLGDEEDEDDLDEDYDEDEDEDEDEDLDLQGETENF